MFKEIIFISLLLSQFASYASTCSTAGMQSHQLKKEAMKASVEITKDYGSNTELLFNQYSKLDQNLKSIRELADISESTIKYCAKNELGREAYYLDDKKKAIQMIVGLLGFDKTFNDNYVIPNDNWTEVARALEKDIIKKQASIKSALTVAIEEKTEKEKVRKVQLQNEAQELEELEKMVGAAKAAQQENDRLEKKIEVAKDKKESSNNPTTISNNRDISKITDQMANYATILGRATACDIDTDHEARRVGSWLDRVFPPGSSEQKTYLPIFMSGMQYHMNQQLEGKSPDTCTSVKRAYESYPWP